MEQIPAEAKKGSLDTAARLPKTAAGIQHHLSLPRTNRSAKYKNQILVARHGSWNKTNKLGGDVVLVNIKKDGSAGPIEPFLTGFLENNNYVGRPVDVMVMKDGSVLVSDDWNGAVWRVSAGGNARTAAR